MGEKFSSLYITDHLVTTEKTYHPLPKQTKATKTKKKNGSIVVNSITGVKEWQGLHTPQAVNTVTVTLACGRNLKTLDEMNDADADEMWSSIVEEFLHGKKNGIPFKDYLGEVSLDDLNPALAFPG